MLYTALWSVISAINEAESGSCSLLIVTNHSNFSIRHSFQYDDDVGDSGSLIDFALEVMKKIAMPIFAIDFGIKTNIDKQKLYFMKSDLLIIRHLYVLVNAYIFG